MSFSPRLRRKRSGRTSEASDGGDKAGLQKAGHSPIKSRKSVALHLPCIQQGLKKAGCWLVPSCRAMHEERAW